jgi:hypothetical protein
VKDRGGEERGKEGRKGREQRGVTEGKRQRGRDRGGETERRDRKEETKQ